MRRAGPTDLPAIRAFLGARVERAMFPLSNLDRFGLDGEADYAPSMWVAEQDGAVGGVLTVGRGGMVMPNLAGNDPAAAIDILRGRAVSGLIGPMEEVRPLLAALGIAGYPATLDRDETHFALDLDDLTVPEGEGSLATLAAADPEEMIRWRADYNVEANGLPHVKAEKEARASYQSYIAAGSHRVLMAGGRPLATSGFNAFLPDIVQIGGVYTPPSLRGRGHARRVVALHLAEARARGVTRATLFSGSDMASRAYRAIGFRRIGQWTLVIFDVKPVVS
ncbi:GNAT family N-acetyltransferase [Defluviimonas salinarum]|uniref:N-acetyltransferase n=1 Tax=Defluviimonas salinarum TaxID=2992147 RepID=A0ABT3IYE1_9RHOB|nr:GNAT family N-acetyltransferase [Defluviimonas salinarum]MCW3780453.1 N-acetyltransferase [Defluviimonas salinarum]